MLGNLNNINGTREDINSITPVLAQDMISLVEAMWRRVGCSSDQEKDIWFRAVLERSRVVGLDELLDANEGSREELKRFEAFLVSSPDVWIEFFGSAVDGAFEGLAKRIVAAYTKKRGKKINCIPLLVTRTEEVLLTHQRLLKRIIDIVYSSNTAFQVTNDKINSLKGNLTPLSNQSISIGGVTTSPHEPFINIRGQLGDSIDEKIENIVSSGGNTPVSLMDTGRKGEGKDIPFQYFNSKGKEKENYQQNSPQFPSYKSQAYYHKTNGTSQKGDIKKEVKIGVEKDNFHSSQKNVFEKCQSLGDSVMGIVKKTSALPPLAPSLSTKLRYQDIDGQILAAEWEDLIVITDHRKIKEGSGKRSRPGLYGKLPCQNTKTSRISNHNFPKLIAGKSKLHINTQISSYDNDNSENPRSSSNSFTSSNSHKFNYFNDSVTNMSSDAGSFEDPVNIVTNPLNSLAALSYSVGGQDNSHNEIQHCRGNERTPTNIVTNRKNINNLENIAYGDNCDIELPDLPQITYQSEKDSDILQNFGPMNKTTVELTKAFIDALQIVNGSKSQETQLEGSFEKASPRLYRSDTGVANGGIGGEGRLGKSHPPKTQRTTVQSRFRSSMANAVPTRMYMKPTESSSMKRRV